MDLQSMAQRIRGLAIPSMIIYNYNTASYNLAASRTPQVPENLETVFRVLRVKDCEYKDVIRNVLLDQTSAERLLLVEVRASTSSSLCLTQTVGDGHTTSLKHVGT